MTDSNLEQKALHGLMTCRLVALDNLKFYESVFDGMKESPDRDKIGQALAQKHAFIDAVDVILKNHDMHLASVVSAPPIEGKRSLETVESGDHLKQEERFHSALKASIDDNNDDVTTQLLAHHLDAAEIALAALKSTSLKI